MKLRNLAIIIMIAAIAGCKPKIEEFTPSNGTADFTTYVSVGNSLTAGYASGALSSTGQMYSFPNILASQLKKVGMQGEFKQPILASEQGIGFRPVPGGMPVLVTKLILGLSTDCMNVTSLGPVPANPNPDQTALFNLLTTPIADQGPFNNVGVPGMKSFHALVPGYGANESIFRKV